MTLIKIPTFSHHKVLVILVAKSVGDIGILNRLPKNSNLCEFYIISVGINIENIAGQVKVDILKTVESTNHITKSIVYVRILLIRKRIGPHNYITV